jgi:cell division protein FtsL
MNVYVREYQKFERKSRRRDSFIVRYLPILLVLAGAVVVGKIYAQSVAIEWSEHLLELKERSRDLELQNSELERTIATLRTRERIAQEAGERLGMVVPTEDAVLWLTVLDRSPHAAIATATPRDPRAVVGDWLDALWQEEALALTSE